MKIHFLGATKTVTGSMHILEINHQYILVDCGLYQGRREEANDRNRNLPFAAERLATMVLSHAHIDHCGNIPTLVKKGFQGKIHTIDATVELCRLMLADSGHIQEKDIEYLNKKRQRRGESLLMPLYTQADAEAAMEFFQPHEYHRPFQLLDGVTATFYDAGHILGSALTKFTIKENGRSFNLGYILDLGRKNLPILRDPEQLADLDYVIIESTYGGRIHDSILEVEEKLIQIIQRAIARNGKIIIPSFALERTQEIVYCLNNLWNSKRVPQIPVFVDSPLAVNVTSVFKEYEQYFDEETKALIRQNDDPFGFARLKYVRDVEESKKLNSLKEPCIIISASGMCETGRILHHLKNNIENPNNIILIVGFMAQNTLGRKLVERWPVVKIFGEEYHLNAEVVIMNAFSAHADRNDLLAYLQGTQKKLRQAFLVHGEEKQSQQLADALAETGFSNIIIPSIGDTYEV
ncbi:MAG: MBL fold metallo-hydrolase [candidate division KSB1 bacterium]|nr:MBL fold metallo-hydrolase [candidate division KSB1 bacterium]